MRKSIKIGGKNGYFDQQRTEGSREVGENIRVKIAVKGWGRRQGNSRKEEEEEEEKEEVH